jgi:hypothetical protein
VESLDLENLPSNASKDNNGESYSANFGQHPVTRIPELPIDEEVDADDVASEAGDKKSATVAPHDFASFYARNGKSDSGDFKGYDMDALVSAIDGADVQGARLGRNEVTVVTDNLMHESAQESTADSV